ncbi:unnamed protein product [Amoebophrya sp. A120]|nr:unnamed protein product [Amoebophrya sp. A120]|eukprot:GSA120T00001061001.1
MVLLCAICQRPGHEESQCEALICPGCERVIQSSHNSLSGNFNNLRAHKQACVACNYNSDFVVTCGICDHKGHADWECNAVFCTVCHTIFQTRANNSRNNENMRQQHMQTHLSRTVTCPLCRQSRFRSAAGVASHVEGGFCSCVPGRTNGEAAVYQFVKQRMPNYINRAICDANDVTDWVNPNYVPANAFQCKHCYRTFNKFTSLTQHIEAKHQRNAPQLPPMLLNGY